MNYLKRLLFVLALLSTSSGAFEFNNSNATYDFTQTLNIYILDEKNSKFFAMVDPFEMKVTTMPSRFYVAVMGVLERGHKNGEGVYPIEGAATGYEFVLMFRSLNNSHVMFIGNNWIIDGNKKILLSPQEVKAIYEILLMRSNQDQARDLQSLEGLLKKINTLQDGMKGSVQISADDELKSIIESKNSIQERLPESHNDMKTLPYYNKSLENEKFLEEYEKAKKLAEQNTQPIIEPDIPAEAANSQDKLRTEKPSAEIASTAEEQATYDKRRSATTNEESVDAIRKTTSQNSHYLLIVLIGLAMVVCFALYKWRARNSAAA